MITKNIYTSSDYRYMDETSGIDPAILMENAAMAVYERIRGESLPPPYVIVCGKGNNGGDGWCLACLMHRDGKDVRVLKIREPSSPLTLRYAKEYESLGGRSGEDISLLQSCGSVIDCLFGFSFRGALRSEFISVVEEINSCGAKVLSVDVPSGLDCDEPEKSLTHVKADITCTFTGLKRALALYPYREECGSIFVEDIGIPDEVISSRVPLATEN